MGLLEKTERSECPRLIILDENEDDNLCSEVEQLQEELPDARLVVLSNDFDFDAMVGAFRAGVDGYIVKRIACEPLIESLKLVHMGEKVMPSELAAGLPRRWARGALPAMSQRELVTLLSDREIETLRYLILGSPNKVIAGHLNISEATVKVHVKAILRKLGVQNRTQAAIWAVNNGVDLKKPELVVAANEAQDNKPDYEEERQIAV
ncbi:MAG: response regulator transcription factor [Pseudomonadota bacterium]